MKKIIASALLLLCSTVAMPAFAGTINFENMPQSYWFYGGQQNFGNYWQGVTFGPDSTILEDQVYGYNSGGYPAHSGHAVLFSINTPYITATFDNPVDTVSMWYTNGAGSFQLDAYDKDGNLIASTLGPNNYGTTNEISVSSLTSDIKWVTMLGTGNYFTIDDFTAPFVSGQPNNPVPEPSTLFLLGAGLAGLGFVRRRAKK